MKNERLKSVEFLEDLQGIILLISQRSNYRASLKEVLSKDPEILKDLVHELKNSDPDNVRKQLLVAKTMSKEMPKDDLDKLVAKLNHLGEANVKERVSDFLKVEKSITKYQNPYTYKTIEDLLSKMMDTLGSMKYTISELPIFASTQTFNFNACAFIPVNCSIPLVIFEDELFMNCYILSKILVSAIPITFNSLNIGKESVFDHLDENDWVVKKFIEFLFINTTQSSVAEIKPFQVKNKEAVHFLSMMTGSIEQFIMAHEMGHVIDGHVYSKNRSEFEICGSEKISTPSWDKEFIADKIGLEITIEILTNACLLYTSPSPRDQRGSRMPSSA